MVTTRRQRNLQVIPRDQRNLQVIPRDPCNLQVTTRSQRNLQVVASNSENDLAKVWDSQFKEVRAQIVRLMKPLLVTHRILSASDIKRFRSCVCALPHFRLPVLLNKARDLFGLVNDICAYGRSTTSASSPSLVLLLQVFIKEVLAHPILRCLLDPSKMLIHEASGAPLIQELILGHLCLSFPKQICLNFTDSFCHSLVMSTALNDGKFSELGFGLDLDTTLVLLNTSFNHPMPYLLQSHLAISASRCIETQNPLQVLGLGFEQAISAFELSAKLYWRSLCNLDLGQRSRPYLSRGAKKPPHHAPDYHMDEMKLLFKPTSSGEASHKDLFLWISSYIDEIQQVVHESTRLQTGDALKGIVSVLLANKVLEKTQVAGCKTSEELVSVASLERLMASSLFRVVAEARAMLGHAESHGNRGSDVGLEMQVMSSLELESNGGCRLVGRKADHLVSKILLDAISGGFSSRKRSVMMLQHFSKLMLVGLRARAEFLWKACILVLSAIMNLMAFEGEDFDALKILAGDARDREETANGSDHKRKCSAKQLDASVLPNSKRMHLEDEVLVNGDGSCQSIVVYDRPVFVRKKVPAEVRENLSDGMVNLIEHPPEDLVDFFDCSPDMDLPFWLKEREGLFKKRQAAQKKKKKMLLRFLGASM